MKQKEKTSLKKITLYSAGILGGFVLWFWDEAIFVAPIAAVTAWIGPLLGWVIMASLYFVLFFGLSVLTLQNYKRNRKQGLSVWIERQIRASQKSRFYKFIETGKNGAIAMSCFFLGGLITANLVYRLRLWPNVSVVTTSLVCNAIFAITWVGFYSGAFGLLFTLLRKVF